MLKDILNRLLVKGTINRRDVVDIENNSQGLIGDEFPINGFTVEESKLYYDEVIMILKSKVTVEDEDTLEGTMKRVAYLVKMAGDRIDMIEDFNEVYPVSPELVNTIMTNNYMSVYIKDETGENKLVDVLKTSVIEAIPDVYKKLDHINNYEDISKLLYKLEGILSNGKDISIKALGLNGDIDKVPVSTLLSSPSTEYLNKLKIFINRANDMYISMARDMRSADISGLEHTFKYMMDETALIIYKVIRMTTSKD